MPAAAANRVRNIMIAITQGIGPDSRPSGSKRRLAERLPCFLPHGAMFSLRPAQGPARLFVADAADNADARSHRTVDRQSVVTGRSGAVRGKLGVWRIQEKKNTKEH